MADRNGITIRVESEKLKSTADDVEGKIQRLEQVFQSVEQTINASRSYWEGDGCAAYLRAYQKKAADIQTAFKRFRENVTDLRSIAGIYEEAEHDVLANNEELRVDMIV